MGELVVGELVVGEISVGEISVHGLKYAKQAACINL